MYNAELLAQSLPKTAVYVFESLDSTSAFLKRELIKKLQPSLCVSKLQTNGYGQRGSTWISNEDSITFSICLSFKASLNNVVGLSQLVALRLRESLSLFTQDNIKLKWPNDLFVNDAKIGGLLIEVLHHTEEEAWLIIGVGLNVGDFQVKPSGNYQVAGMTFDNVDRDKLLIYMAKDLIKLSETFHPLLWLQKVNEWKQVDIFNEGEQVILLVNSNEQRFFYVGLSDKGSLMLSTVAPKSEEFTPDSILLFNSGTVSIRRLGWLH